MCRFRTSVSSTWCGQHSECSDRTLNLHSVQELVAYEALREMETPPATPTHVPIPHFRLIDLVRTTLGMFRSDVEPAQRPGVGRVRSIAGNGNPTGNAYACADSALPSHRPGADNTRNVQIGR